MKKQFSLLSLVLIFALIGTLLVHANTSASYGDVNGDGEKNAQDALLVLKLSVDKEVFGEQQRTAADVTGEGTIDALDALEILKYAVGMIYRFPVEYSYSPVTPTDPAPEPPSLPQAPEDTTKDVVEINTVNFPDEMFRTDVQAFDLNKNGWLSEYEISKVTVITADRYLMSVPEIQPPVREAIQSLTGIEYFTELRRLFCSDNALTELDISKNKKLEVLGCANNSLTSLNLKENAALTGLYCAGNQLEQLDVSANVELKTLWCKQNSFQTLDVTKNEKLTSLQCDEDVTLTGWPKEQ